MRFKDLSILLLSGIWLAAAPDAVQAADDDKSPGTTKADKKKKVRKKKSQAEKKRTMAKSLKKP